MKILRLIEGAAAVFFFTVFAVLIISGSLEGLENRTLDWRYRNRPEQETKTRISLVLITDECLTRLGNWPVPRSYYADIIDKLASAGANTIAFDIIFEDPLTADPSGDEAFITSCRRFGKVVFPLVFTEQQAFDASTGEIKIVEEVRRPFKALSEVAAGFGFINADFGFLNSDGVLQKTFLAHLFKGQWMPGFPLAIAEKVAGAKSSINENGVLFNKQLIPLIDLPPWKPVKDSWSIESGKAIFINFLGSQYQEPFPIYSFADIVEGKFDASGLRDTVVLVGPSAVGLGDLKLTPHGLKPGVIAHATLLENILTSNFLRAPSIPSQILLLAAFALFTLFILRLQKPFLLVTAFYAFILWGYSAFCHWCFSARQLVLPMTAPLLMSVAHYIVVRFFQLFASLKLANEVLRDQNVQLDQQVHELVALHHAGSRLPAILEMQVLAEEVITKFCELRPAEAGLLVYFTPETGQPQPLGQVVGSRGEAFLQEFRKELTDNLQNVFKDKTPVIASGSTLFSSYLPILVGKSCWGAVCLLETKQAAGPIHSAFFWETLLGIAGTALENARLYEMAREVSLAKVVQANFLPNKPLEFNGYRVSGSSRPATQLGGDYFDYFTVDDRYLVVIIADVMGHGVPAALGMTIVKTSVLQRIKEGFSIEGLIDTINETLVNIQKQRLMVTAQFTLIDTLEHKTTIFHRGHVFPLRRDALGAWSIVTCVIAPPLGVKKRSQNLATPVTVNAGERLLFFTDGIYESLADVDEETMKIAALQNYLLTRPVLAIDEACVDILDHHPSFLSGLPQPDDYTVLLLEREPDHDR